MPKNIGEWWNGGWQRRGKSEWNLENESIFRKNDDISVSLVQKSRGFWVDGEPTKNNMEHPSNFLPTIKQEEIKSYKIKPRCVAKDLGFGDAFYFRDIENIKSADEKLVKNGYRFIGYHGTNKANLRSMFDDGLNPKYCGSGDGEARGSGFYIAASPEKAMDYADASTQSGDPLPPRFDIIPRYEGERGQPELARVYAKNFVLFKAGIDFAWGVESSDGDPNGDRVVRSVDITENGLIMNAESLEMVISPSRYPDLAILPSLHSVGCEHKLSEHFKKQDDTKPYKQKWPSHRIA